MALVCTLTTVWLHHGMYTKSPQEPALQITMGLLHILHSRRPSKKGNLQLVVDGFIFHSEKRRGLRQYWQCIYSQKTKCRARVITSGQGLELRHDLHNHEAHTENIKHKLTWHSSLVQFVESARGNPQLIFNGFLFNSEYRRGMRQFWQCSFCQKTKCRARVVTDDTRLEVRYNQHNHEPHTDIIEKKLVWNAMRLRLQQQKMHPMQAIQNLPNLTISRLLVWLAWPVFVSVSRRVVVEQCQEMLHIVFAVMEMGVVQQLEYRQ
ncbi:hypothetical protein PR048_032470 [Dryococelus australis]|uniref:FLYWCH-type domain-containing protein n=1 Tax=Dryococelus australis TaxID=614101 RepID=A0ABQ9G2A5_9NEOP|nr:hypothetical protein PR048_032470 [Dryococelus australis]